jgi:hypothetical protein
MKGTGETSGNFEELKPASHVMILGTILNEKYTTERFIY